MRLSLVLLYLLLAAQANASAQINYLNIESDAVHFSLNEEKVHTIPSCVAAETNKYYAFSLKTDAGRAMYSLLITAMAAKQAISVESAGDCADVIGIERIKSLNIMPTIAAPPSGSGKAFYLYKGDGITKLGSIVSAESGGGKIYFLDINDRTIFKQYHKVGNIGIYFSEIDCKGVAYYQIANRILKNHNYHNEMYFKSSLLQVYTTRNSYLDHTGECKNKKYNDAYLFALESYEDPLCGASPCIIKEE